MTHRFKAFFLLLAAACLTAEAQTVTGTILGIVTDPSGAVVPGASVTATNRATGFSRSAKTDRDGNYLITFLPLGAYNVQASSGGFERTVRENIAVQADERARVDFALKVGAATQTVEVSEGTPLVQTSDATVGEVVDSKHISDLPLNKRNFVDLVQLTAGVTPGRPADFGGDGTIDNFRGRFVFSANGQRVTTNNFILDGVDNNAALFNAGGVVIAPIVDSIEEFKVSISNFSPEFGRAAGAVMSVQTKAGSNQLHGTLFEFLRNNVLDSNTFFNNTAGQPNPPFHQNQFGFTVGGPIVKNRTFFFGDYQGFRVADTYNFVSNVPTLQERQGTFTGGPYGTIYDPATAVANSSGGLTLQPFAGNTIPAPRLDPVALKILTLYPLSNTGAAGALASNYINNPVLNRNDNQFDIRIDHRINDSNNFFGRYSLENSKQLFPNALLSPTDPFGGGSGKGNTGILHGQSLALNYIHTFSPRFLSETRGGFTRTLYNGLPLGNGNPLLNSINIPNQRYNNTIQTIPTFSVSGLTAVGPQSNVPNLSVANNFQGSQNFSYTIGSGHTLKFGGDFIRRQLNNDFIGSAPGTFSFSGIYTTSTAAGSAQNGNAVADFLLGLPAGSTQSLLLGGFGRRDIVASGYFQDDMKLTRRLTVNAGVRWDLWTPWVEVHDRQTNFDFATGQLVVASPNGPFGRALRDTNSHNFAPRLGLAYDLTGSGKTVLRSGYSINYIEDLSGGSTILPFNLPFAYNSQVVNSSGIIPTVTLSQGFPAPVFPSVSNPSGQIEQTAVNYRTEYAQNWNVGIQHQLASNYVLDVAYVGNKGTHLQQRINGNQPYPAAGNLATHRPYYAIDPNITTVDGLLSTDNSTYESLQVKFTKRFASGLSFLVNYTYGKAIEGSEGVGENGVTAAIETMAQNPLDRAAEKALATFDSRSRFVASYVYELPFGKGKPYLKSGLAGQILGNWRVDGITTFLDGNPFTVQMATSTLNTGTFQRPNAICDGNIGGAWTIARFFNTSCYVAPGAFIYGNAGRNILTGPATANWDFSVQRTFPVMESRRFELRGEFFNLFNTPAFYPPQGSVGLPNFGQLTAIRTGSNRQIQVALKFYF